MLEKVNLAEKLASFDDAFSPRIVGRYNDTKIQVVKTRGEFVWHSHAETDDLFLVLDGNLRVELRDGVVDMGAGDLLVVPKGVEHRPVADEEAHVLLLELAGTPNTGDSGAEAAPEVEL